MAEFAIETNLSLSQPTHPVIASLDHPLYRKR